MRIYLTSLMLCLALPLPSQSNDTLLLRLNAAAADTNKVNLLLDYGKSIQYDSTGRTLEYYKQAAALAHQLGYTFGEGRAIQMTGVVHMEHGRYIEASEYLNRAIPFFQQSGQHRSWGATHECIGNLFNTLGDYQSALSNYQEAEKHYRQARRLKELRSLYVNMSSMYGAMFLFDKQLEYAQKALDIARDDGSPRALSFALGVNASSMYNLKRFEEAEKFGKEALSNTLKTGNKWLLKSIYSDLGRTYTSLKHYADADTCFQKSLSLAEQLSPFSVAQTLDGLGYFYIEQSKWPEAGKIFRRMLGIALREKLKSEQMLACDALATIEYQTGHFRQAYDYARQFAALKDSVAGEDTQNQLTLLEIKYETEKKEAEIRDLENQNHIQSLTLQRRNFLIYSALASILALLVVLWLSRRAYRQKQQLQLEKIERLESERKVVALNAHLEGQQRERLRIAEDLHDDFGSGLSKISLLSEVAKKKAPAPAELDKIAATAKELLLKMSEIVWTLNHRNDTLPSLAAYIRRYAVGFFEDSGVRCHFNIPDLPEASLSGETRRNVFLAVKESLHNILKHAGASKVDIDFSLNDNQLEIKICDDGKGFDETASATAGNGLRNMEKRISAAGGSFRLDSAPGKGTAVGIFLPVAKEEKRMAQAA